MNDNGLGNVMEIIKRQKWENLFKRRELVHIDAVKELYAKLTVIHLKKKDVVKSSVKGNGIEFDHEKAATILGVPGKNGICEYIEDVWEESKYTKPLKITRRVANNETLTAARRVKSEEEAEKEDEGNKDGFDGEAVIDEAVVEGESARESSFMMLKIRIKVLQKCKKRFRASSTKFDSARWTKVLQSRPSCPTGRIHEVEMTRLQAEFERKRANRFLADLEKAKAENARLLALLHQAQSKPHP
ncbi:hypothetical protein Dimus_022316 [Dionaea muscipula]